MKKLLLVLGIVSLLLSCNNGDMDKEDLFSGDNPLIGTWSDERMLFTFIDDTTVKAGEYAIKWDGTTDKGKEIFEDEIYEYEFDRTPTYKEGMEITVFSFYGSDYFLYYYPDEKYLRNPQTLNRLYKIRK
jgi:hypothetical protein